MTLDSGTRIGPYEIVGFLGAGGMGQVWRARDTRLGREVAIKTLAPELAADPDRLARLEREARLLAALNHPNIATIHGLEEQDGRRFLVLELIDGLTLADRLGRGALGIESTLRIALQIAAALEAAHEKGVIHRDLKPANVKITPDGHVKVLDFGLARSVAMGDNGGRAATVVHSEVGVVTGTAPYMSPEQARGEPTGPQTDIWSFGVMLYEMLTRISPFQRDTATETLARVLETQPDFAQLPPSTPPGVQRLVRRCLEKDTKRRFRNVGDVCIELEDALAGLTSGSLAAASGDEPRGSAWRNASIGLALVVLAALAGIGAWWIESPGGTQPGGAVVRLSAAGLPPRAGSPVGASHIAVSPDGARFAYASSRGLLIRDLARSDALTIDDGEAATNPFFSTDGDWVGYVAGGIKKVPAIGGPAVQVVETTERVLGGTWCKSDAIVYATTSGLYRVASDGGAPQRLIEPDRERQERELAWPQCLPDGRTLLFTVLPVAAGDSRIAWLDLDTLERRDLVEGGTSPRYATTGHLLYAVGQQLMVVGFDARTRALRGARVALRDVRIATAPDNGAAEYSVSANGLLAFIAPTNAARQLFVLEWVNRAGDVEPLGVEPGVYFYPRVSPDGTRVAIDVAGGKNRDIWIWDTRLRSLTRLTDGPTEDMLPVWSPDGRRVFFASNRTGNFDIYSQAADGATPARVEYEDPKFQAPNSFTPDGSKLVINEEFQDLSVLNLAGPVAEPLLHRDPIDWLGEVSPDGHWLAYESNESGTQFEIYVRPFPDVAGQREKVSIDGGRHVVWGPPGSDELYYVDLAGALMAVPIKTSPALELGRAVKLFDFVAPGRGGQSGRTYDVSRIDGRFLRSRALADTGTDDVDVSIVLNWSELLRPELR